MPNIQNNIFLLFICSVPLLSQCYCKVNAWGRELVSNVDLENYSCPRIVFATRVSSNHQDVITCARDF